MKTMIAFVLASGIGLTASVSLVGGFSDTTGLDTLEAKEFARLNGISEIVYDCAFDLLKDKSVEELVGFIENDIPQTDTLTEPTLVSAVRECIYLDPLGWHGTPNEWAIELLETDKWER
jgi:hypothetical protein